MKTSPLSKPLRGFTLIELLTVIAIIGILAAIIIPTVGRVRQTARESVNKSNLRQIGMAANIYANENKDRFPVAWDGSNSWYTNPHMSSIMYGKEVVNWQGKGQSIITVSPTADFPPDGTGLFCHYSMHPRMGRASSDQLFLSRGKISRPSQVILFADSTQQNMASSNASPMLYEPLEWQWGSGSSLTAPIPAAQSANGLDPYAALRYRNSDSVHATMVDGSVKSFKRGTVTYGNIVAL